MNYLSKEDLLDLHTHVLETYGGLMGIRSQDQLQNLVNTPRQEMFGSELYPDTCSKATIFVYQLITHQPFVAGNELTALLALLRMLEMNDLSLRSSVAESELAWVFRALKQGNMDREALDTWLRKSIEQPSA